MLLPQIDPTTGLPLVKETRSAMQDARALPRKFHDHIYGNPKTGVTAGQAWRGEWQAWSGTTLISVKCWKCGDEIRGWRLALDSGKRAIEIAGKYAVRFQPLNHYRETHFSVYLPLLDRRRAFTVLHCADCTIKTEHGLEVTTCFLQGHDAGLRQAWKHGAAPRDNADWWASFLHRWKDAEPEGVMPTLTDEGENQHDLLLQEYIDKAGKLGGLLQLPTPGEQLTAARYFFYAESAKLNRVPAGVTVAYAGKTAPSGWLMADGSSVDQTADPDLYAVIGATLPSVAGQIIKR